MNKKITVLYILGYGHSGSTLLNSILATSNNVFSAGEIINFENKKKFVRNNDNSFRSFCDCGKKIDNCDFWKSIYNKYEHSNFTSKNSLLVYIKLFLNSFFNIKFKKFEKGSNDFSFLEDILSTSQKKYGKNISIIVDSSKSLERLNILYSNPEIDLKVIFLTRDGRAVVNSLQKKNEFFIYTFIKWFLNNFLMSRYVKKKIKSDNLMNLSYDLFAKDPHRYIDLINRKFGLLIDKDSYVEKVNSIQFHNLGGNSSRKKKFIGVRYDQSWRGKLSFFKKIVVNILCYIPNKLWVYNKK